jgi:Icc-related predicted phosphoesterase
MLAKTLTYQKTELLFPPTKNSSGKAEFEHDKKEIIKFDENIFDDNVIFMSDMHSHTQKVIEYLLSNYDLSKFIVITLGDMWGNGFMGSDGDPTPFYELLYNNAKALYIIQGNHDLPPSDASEFQKLVNMKNKDKTYCLLKNGIPFSSSIGIIGGVHGTISNKKHAYKMPEKEYVKYLKSMVGKIEILLTHNTPQLFGGTKNQTIGNYIIHDMVCKIKPKIHVYGHCYHHPVNESNGTLFLNADSKILIFENK